MISTVISLLLLAVVKLCAAADERPFAASLQPPITFYILPIIFGVFVLIVVIAHCAWRRSAGAVQFHSGQVYLNGSVAPPNTQITRI